MNIKGFLSQKFLWILRNLGIDAICLRSTVRRTGVTIFLSSNNMCLCMSLFITKKA